MTAVALRGNGVSSSSTQEPPALGRIERAAASAVVALVVLLGVIGAVNSFRAVAEAVEPSFGGLAWTVPVGVDVGIAVFSALDLLLARVGMRMSWLRLVPWVLVATTIYLNVAGEHDPVAAVAHGVLPGLWVIAVEAGCHAAWVADLADHYGRLLFDDQRSSARRLREEAANIDLAVRWALEHEPGLAVRVVGALGMYWSIHDQATGWRWCPPVVALAGDSPTRIRARALRGAGEVAASQHEWTLSLAWLDEALALYRVEDHRRGMAASQLARGRVFGGRQTGLPVANAAAAECYEEAAALYAELGDTFGWGWCTGMLSTEAYLRGELDLADRLAIEVVDRCERTGVLHPVGNALRTRYYVARRRGDAAAGLALLERAAELYRALGDPSRLAGIMNELTTEQARLGQLDDALVNLARLVRLDELARMPPERPFILTTAAVIHGRGDDPALALAAMAAYDAHPRLGADRLDPRPKSPFSWIGPAIEEIRTRLDPAALAAATAAARGRNFADLVDEVILTPAQAVRSAEPPQEASSPPDRND